ncbi:piggyBac transposable element-derived protein 4-like [Schistocerca piceifrons]|uniref:piggyBac transposable element-derived protein 4-like n=1 Tax=Schistocerca piceifrons TaxID=274613 RepID=UPI001F5E9084|nr:piggyBac transposable element-derived protein 4-like [Schistocerca piceifrons]
MSKISQSNGVSKCGADVIRKLATYLSVIYTLAKKNSGPEVGLGESVVLQLTKSLSGLGCEIYIDNFFNSPALQYYLGLQNIRSCGTVHTNRKNIPMTFPPDKEMKRGDSYSLSSNGLTIIKWMDNKPVFLMTNFISPIPCTTVKRRQSGSSEKINVQCALMIRKYKWMGGVDLTDQKKVTYEIDRKAKIKYYMRIFFDLLDIGVNNAYVIYSELAEESGLKSTLSSLEFRQCIVRNLIGNYSSRQKNLSTVLKTSRRSQTSCNPKNDKIRLKEEMSSLCFK